MSEKRAGRRVGGPPPRGRGCVVVEGVWRRGAGKRWWWWWCDGTVCAPRPGCCLERCCLGMVLEFRLELIHAEQHVMEGTSCGTVSFLVPLLTCFNGEMSTTFLSQILRFLVANVSGFIFRRLCLRTIYESGTSDLIARLRHRQQDLHLRSRKKVANNSRLYFNI